MEVRAGEAPAKCRPTNFPSSDLLNQGQGARCEVAGAFRETPIPNLVMPNRLRTRKLPLNSWVFPLNMVIWTIAMLKYQMVRISCKRKAERWASWISGNSRGSYDEFGGSSSAWSPFCWRNSCRSSSGIDCTCASADELEEEPDMEVNHKLIS